MNTRADAIRPYIAFSAFMDDQVGRSRLVGGWHLPDVAVHVIVVENPER